MIFLPAAVYAAVLLSQPFEMPRYAVELPAPTPCNPWVTPVCTMTITPAIGSQILPLTTQND